ncbi:MAG: NAD(P)-dependent oxidoreductase [Sphingomonas bacterium]|nr:NAD(P)-dependent oxidoreductase [Sphingomonas bacterium]
MGQSKRIFLTGAAGYIGSRLAVRLIEHGHEVVGLDREKAPEGVGFADYIQADLLEPEAYSDILASCPTIFHLAAAKGDWGISDEEYGRDNVEATDALIAAASDANVEDWVFYSTVSVLGPSDIALSEEAPHAPANPYGSSKAKGERAFDALVKRSPSVRVLTIRPSVVFGPENPWNTNIYRLIDSIARRRFIMIGDGRQIKTTSFIDNLIDATIHLFDRRALLPGQDIYHCIDEPTISVAAMVHFIRQRLNARATAKLPLWLVAPVASVADLVATLLRIDLPITSARIKKFSTATNFSAAKLQSTGFRPRWSIEDGLSETIAWHEAKRKTAA